MEEQYFSATKRFLDHILKFEIGKQVAILLLIMERMNKQILSKEYKKEFCDLLTTELEHCWQWLGHKPKAEKAVENIITLIHYTSSPFDDSVEDFGNPSINPQLAACGMTCLIFLGYISSQVKIINGEAADLKYSMTDIDLGKVLTKADWALLMLEPEE